MNGRITGYTSRLLRIGWTQKAVNDLVVSFMSRGDMEGLEMAIIAAEKQKTEIS